MSNYMNTYFVVTVPVTRKDGIVKFPRVGALFPSKDGQKTAFNIKLDFPVGVTEFVIFEPKHYDEDDNQE